MRSSFAFLAAGSLAITALGRLVDFDSAPEANMASGGTLTAEPLGGGNPDVDCLGPSVVSELHAFRWLSRLRLGNHIVQPRRCAFALAVQHQSPPGDWSEHVPLEGRTLRANWHGLAQARLLRTLSLGLRTMQGTDGTTLGIDCSDPYTASRNGSQGGLGPKYQVNATTGFFPYPPANPSYSGSTARRCRVPSSDVIASENPSAVYFMEGQYVCPDDSPDDTGDASNNSSHRRLNMAASGSISSFDWPNHSRTSRHCIVGRLGS